uniref:Putative secreted protein n=1 Tax=Desmodus rotundus TaxID=9430 RepID=K9IXU3_DESRO
MFLCLLILAAPCVCFYVLGVAALTPCLGSVAFPVGFSGTASLSPKLGAQGAPFVWAEYSLLRCCWQVSGRDLPRPVCC